MYKLKFAARRASVISACVLIFGNAQAWTQSQDQPAVSLPNASQQASLEQRTSAVVKNRADLENLMASGPTVLDSLTPYGKREFLKSLRWNERGLTGFSPAAPFRELNREQALAIFDLIDSRDYFPKNFSTAPALRLDDVSPQYERLVDQLKTVIQDDNSRKSRSENHSSEFKWELTKRFYRSHVQALINTNNLARINKSDLYLLFDMAYEVSSTLNSTNALQDMKALYRVFKQRGIDTRRSIDDAMFGALVRHRELEAARRFIAEHEAFADRELPIVFDRLGNVGNRPTVLVDQGETWLRQYAPFRREKPQLVIVLSEGCGFCRKLMSDVDRDEVLRQQLESAETILLTTPSEGDPFEFVKRWNQKHAKLRMYVPNKISEWKGFDSGRVPQFLIVKKGRILHSTFGWQKDGTSKAELLDQLAKYGL